MNKMYKFLGILFFLTLLAGAAGLSYYFKIWPWQSGPRIYLPQDRVGNFSYNPASIQYIKEAKADATGKVLVFTLTSPDNHVTISEQEDTNREAYKEILKKVDDYEELKTQWGGGMISSFGTNNPRTLAAVHIRGTTIFAKSEKSLSVEEWQGIFNGLAPRSMSTR